MRAFLGLLGALTITLPVFCVEVRVVDGENGQALAEATVIFEGSTNKTDAAGLAIGAGARVTVHKAGYVPMTMSWAAGAVPPRLELKLPRGEAIGGRVIDGGSNAVSGATIAIIVPTRLMGPRVALESFPVKTDSNGVWRCDFVPKDPAYLKLEFSHPDFEWYEQYFELATLRAGNARLKVSPVGTVGGRVIDPGGRPIAGAQVVLGHERNISSPEAEGRTDQDGKFAFRRLRPERRMLGVQAEGWAPTLQQLGTNFSPIEVRLDEGKPLRVLVQDEAGQPLEGATATLTELEGTNQTRWNYPDMEWKADARGLMVWSNAPSGNFTWSFQKSGYMGRSHTSLKATNSEVVVKLGPAFSISGTVSDATTGKPMPQFVMNGRYVQPRGSSPGTWYDWGRKTFRDGKFALYYESPLLGGSSEMHDWQFRVEADGYEPAISRVVRDAERGTNIAFELKPQPAPTIQVTAPSAKQRVSAAVALQPANAAPGEIVTVFIKVRIAEGHWIYALDKSGSENLPTRIEAKLPREIQQDGPWRGPEPKLKPDGARAIAGEALFSSRVLVEGYARSAKHKLLLKLEFQVCNDLVCWPPETIDMEAELEVVKPR